MKKKLKQHQNKTELIKNQKGKTIINIRAILVL